MRFFRQTSPLIVSATFVVSLALYAAKWVVLGEVGGITVHLPDLLFALTVIYCIAGALARWRESPLEWLLLAVIGVYVVNFARGLAIAGTTAAGNAFREFAGFSAAVVFVYFWGRTLSCDWVVNRVILLGWAITALCLVQLALGRSLVVSSETVASCDFCEWRPLSSAAALMLGQALLVLFNQAMSLPVGTKRRRKVATLFAFAAALLISNERTALLATLAGLGVIAASLPRNYRNIAIALGATAACAVTLILWIVWVSTGGDDITGYLPRAISWFIKEEGTYAWRVQQWERYLGVFWAGPLLDHIIGQPLGALHKVVVSSDDPGDLVYGAHSEYVTLLLESGFVGVVLFTSVLALALLKGAWLLMRSRGAARPELRWAVAVVVSFAVFSYTYNLHVEQGLLLMLALQVIAAGRLLQREVSSRPGIAAPSVAPAMLSTTKPQGSS